MSLQEELAAIDTLHEYAINKLECLRGVIPLEKIDGITARDEAFMLQKITLLRNLESTILRELERRRKVEQSMIYVFRICLRVPLQDRK